MAVPGEKFVRVNYRHYHTWLIPRSAVCSILSCALISMLVGIILLAIGSFLTPWGAVLFVVGVLCLCVCTCLCLHAYCIFQLKDQETQTTDEIHILSIKSSDLSPTFTVLDKKPPLGPENGLKNGRYGGGSLAKKQVSISPGIGERTIPIQHHGPQQAQVSYVQANKGYPVQSGVYTSPSGQTTLSSGQQGQVTGGYGSSQSGGQLSGNHPPHSGSGQVTVTNYSPSHTGGSHGGYTSHGGGVTGHYASSGGGHVTTDFSPSSSTHLQTGYTHHSGSGQLSPVSYQGSKSGTMSSVSSRGHSPGYVGGPSPGYGYPLQPHQPTPYSTLTQKSVSPVSVAQVQHSHVTKQASAYNEDYDNTAETAPMIEHSQSQSSQVWRPSGRDDPPEPQPLVYPSERRPMTFEKTSSSKMSIYDNMFALDKLDD